MAQWVTHLLWNIRTRNHGTHKKHRVWVHVSVTPALSVGWTQEDHWSLLNAAQDLNERLCLAGIKYGAVEEETQYTPLAATK